MGIGRPPRLFGDNSHFFTFFLKDCVPYPFHHIFRYLVVNLYIFIPPQETLASNMPRFTCPFDRLSNLGLSEISPQGINLIKMTQLSKLNATQASCRSVPMPPSVLVINISQAREKQHPWSNLILFQNPIPQSQQVM